MVRFVWLELTRKCNLHCTHCYAESGPHLPLRGAMQYRDWLDVISQAKANGASGIQFIGGEPLLYPQLESLVAHARDIGIGTIEIFTNSTALTGEKAVLFAKYGVKYATSFYTADQALHDRITERSGSFAKTVAGIKIACELDAPLRVELIDVTGDASVVTDAKKLLAQLGVTRVTTNRVQSIGRGNSGAQPKYAVGDLCGNCGNGRICVTADGNVLPCIMARGFSLGNVLIEPIASIIASKALRQFRKSIEREDDTRKTKLPALAGDSMCGPDHDCGPDHGCGPDNSSCGPDHGCGPDHECGPDHSCGPDHACGPDHGCGPDDRHCGPDEAKPAQPA